MASDQVTGWLKLRGVRPTVKGIGKRGNRLHRCGRIRSVRCETRFRDRQRRTANGREALQTDLFAGNFARPVLGQTIARGRSWRHLHRCHHAIKNCRVHGRLPGKTGQRKEEEPKMDQAFHDRSSLQATRQKSIAHEPPVTNDPANSRMAFTILEIEPDRLREAR